MTFWIRSLYWDMDNREMGS
uniref:Uncharacterized protein n=1 Tax=Arundo donax TaxID=35708 RepID=A0A0A9BF74_ARUDO